MIKSVLVFALMLSACAPATIKPISKPGERSTEVTSSPRPQPRPDNISVKSGPSYAERLDSPEVEMSVMKQALQTKERVFDRMNAESSDVGYMP